METPLVPLPSTPHLSILVFRRPLDVWVFGGFVSALSGRAGQHCLSLSLSLGFLAQMMVFVVLCLVVVAIVSTVSASNDLVFVETFDHDVFHSRRWEMSKHEKYGKQRIPIQAAKYSPDGFTEDLGLHFDHPNKYFAAGHVFPAPIQIFESVDPAATGVNDHDQVFALQFETKFERGLHCSGGLVRLLRWLPKHKSLRDLDGDAPTSIVFGPDGCLDDNRLKFSLNFRNPVSKKFTESHFNVTMNVMKDRRTHLFGLVIKRNNDFDFYVDGQLSYDGNLLVDMVPPINPSKYIDDPEDVKPDNWDDREMIPDLSAVKPDDWDETEPASIPDPSSTMPFDWREDLPPTIPDPYNKQPNEWNIYRDGPWINHHIYNPECENFAGCGPWSPNHMPNPKYKGPWTAPLVPNPNYQGKYVPRKIANPNYFEDLHPALNIPAAKAIAMELWSSDGAVHFDNIVIARTVEALRPMTEMFLLKSAAEKSRHEERVRQSYFVRKAHFDLKGTKLQKFLFYLETTAQTAMAHPGKIFLGFVAVFGLMMLIILIMVWREDDYNRNRTMMMIREEDRLRRLAELEKKKRNENKLI